MPAVWPWVVTVPTLTSSVGGISYGVDDAQMNARIAEITANLPNG